MQRENRHLEYKEKISNTFLKTVSAFANYGSGDIIFGVTDDGKPVGIDSPEQACLQIENKINDSISPVPKYTLDIKPDRTIVLHVEEGPNKPYTYKNQAYRRSDSASLPVDRLEYNELTLIGTNRNFEDLPASDQNLHFRVLEGMLQKTAGIEKMSRDILKTLRLYSDQNGFNHAAEILADDNEFPGTDIVRFGNNIDEIMERITLSRKSLLSQYNEAVDVFRRYYRYEKITGTEREEVFLIPEKAYREAIANALVHRRFDIAANIKVSMFQNRIEVVSPGGLPQGVTEEEYLENQISVLRNPIIAGVFYRLNLIESFGTGIQRIRRSYKGKLVRPEFSVFENSIRIVLPALTAAPDITADEKTVLEVLSDTVWMSRENVDRASGLDKAKTVRILNSLQKKHLLEKMGRGRGTKYRKVGG